MNSDRMSDMTEHNSIKNKVYVALVGMTTIILALMALFFKL